MLVMRVVHTGGGVSCFRLELLQMVGKCNVPLLGFAPESVVIAAMFAVPVSVSVRTLSKPLRPFRTQNYMSQYYSW